MKKTFILAAILGRDLDLDPEFIARRGRADHLDVQQLFPACFTLKASWPKPGARKLKNAPTARWLSNIFPARH